MTAIVHFNISKICDCRNGSIFTWLKCAAKLMQLVCAAADWSSTFVRPSTRVFVVLHSAPPTPPAARVHDADAGLGAGCKQRLRHACFTGAAPLGKTAGVGAHARRGARAIFVGCDTPPPRRHSPTEHLQPIRSAWTRRHGKSIYDSTAQLTQRHACCCCVSSWEGIWFYRVDASRCVHFQVCASMENDSAK